MESLCGSDRKYKLIKDGDRIAVCISGGKDSMLLARMLKMAKDYRLYDFSLEYIMMNPGYMERDMKQMEFNNLLLIFRSRILIQMYLMMWKK